MTKAKPAKMLSATSSIVTVSGGASGRLSFENRLRISVCMTNGTTIAHMPYKASRSLFLRGISVLSLLEVDLRHRAPPSWIEVRLLSGEERWRDSNGIQQTCDE